MALFKKGKKVVKGGAKKKKGDMNQQYIDPGNQMIEQFEGMMS